MIKGWSSVTYLRKQTWFDGFHNTWWSSDGQAMVKRWSNNVGAQISFTAILMWNFKTETKERIAGGKSGNNSLSFELAREKVYHHFMMLLHDHGSVKEAKEDGARIWRQTLSWTRRLYFFQIHGVYPPIALAFVSTLATLENPHLKLLDPIHSWEIEK